MNGAWCGIWLCLLLACTPRLPGQQRTEPPEPRFGFLRQPPAGLPPMPLPTDYAPSESMFELGRRLFHDGILSADRSITCSSCHPAATGFASAQPRPAGVHGRTARRHAPSLWNRGYGERQRWDGGTDSLESFVLEPIADPDEMGLSLEAVLDRLRADEDYERAFRAAFGEPPSPATLQRALATFVRGIVRGDAAYDRFIAGDADALTTQQRTGLWLFESKGGCWQCHTPPLFTDESFHNTGVGVQDGLAEPGRARVTGRAADTGRWKTPTLRGTASTAPYMHDGSLATLALVVAFYARGGNPNEHLAARLRPVSMTAAEQAALVAFLESL